ncbi:MAG: hypothetical protein ABJN65_04560 [Parasphingorhabdus sp.]
MKESIFRSSEIQHHNDDDSVKLSRTGKSEKTKLSLRHIRKVHKIKSDGLGNSYSALGDSAWQILCEIHLHNLDEKKIDIASIQTSMSLSRSIAIRYLEVLKIEMLVEESTVNDQSSHKDLRLTKWGQSKVQAILEECAEAFTSIFTYSQPRAVPSD